MFGSGGRGETAMTPEWWVGHIRGVEGIHYWEAEGDGWRSACGQWRPRQRIMIGGSPCEACLGKLAGDTQR